MSDERAMPLTASQFEKLLAATEKWDGKIGKELYALFLIQRWSGLRITDVLLLKRSAISGNTLKTITQKSGALYTGELPDHVLKAITALRTERHPHSKLKSPLPH